MGANNNRLSPRQKMINLMYIVLTAMLALNVSSDVLDGFDTIKVCTAYRMPDGSITTDFPFSVGNNAEGAGIAEPIYEELPGWRTVLSSARSEEELPEAFRNYVAYIEQKLGVPVAVISVGPDREETIIRH